MPIRDSGFIIKPASEELSTSSVSSWALMAMPSSRYKLSEPASSLSFGLLLLSVMVIVPDISIFEGTPALRMNTPPP